ncbi:MAG: hypothetical protein JOY58_09965 [Solirubrobacterales bacterium]|nr:hypothetical protein [Solirubrobacterales bacterium]
MWILVDCAALLLVVTAMIDVVGGRINPGDEAPYLLIVAGWLLLRGLAKHTPASEGDQAVPATG